MPVIPFQRSASAISQSPSVRDLVDSISSLIPRQPAPEIATTPTLTVDPRDIIKSTILQARQAQTTTQTSTPYQVGVIPQYYNFSGPTPGTVVGIVLGSVAAFLFVFWLLFVLTGATGGANIAGEEEIVVRRRRSKSPHSRRSRRSSRPEVREYSRSPRRSTVIVEERRGPRPRSVIVEERRERRVPGDDVVEVIEEDVYRPRRGSARYPR